MNAIANPLRQLVHAALVARELFRKPPPFTQWSAIVHDEGGRVRVQIGPRRRLVVKLSLMAITSSTPEQKAALEQSAQNIIDAPEMVPVFLIDDTHAGLVLTTAAALRAAFTEAS